MSIAAAVIHSPTIVTSPSMSRALLGYDCHDCALVPGGKE
jgi:hypothetical protein